VSVVPFVLLAYPDSRLKNDNLSPTNIVLTEKNATTSSHI